MGWTTINENNEQVEIVPKKLNSGLDTIKDLEKYTTYNFSLGQKVDGLGVTIEKDVKQATQKVEEVISKSFDYTSYFKYIPFAIIAMFILKKRA